MKTIRFAIRSLWREARGGELLVLLAALSIAVGSVTAIGFLTDRVGQAVSAQAAEVLAADLRLRASSPLDAARLTTAKERGLESATTTTFPSVVFFGDDSALTTIKAVSEGYPLRGRLRVAKDLLGADIQTDALPGPGEAWAETALLARLGAAVGNQIDLGEHSLRVTKVLRYRPDQSGGFTNLAPSLLIRESDVAATGLLGEGSRASFAQLFAGDRDAVQEFVEEIRPALSESVRLETQGEASGNLNQAIDRASRFLGLASLVSLLLAAVAVAMCARRFAERRLDSAALMKSLGASQNFVLNVNALQLVFISVIASAVGGLIGFAGERALSAILANLLRAELPQASLQPLILGFGTAAILLVGFALPSLIRLKNSPPLRVLRHDLSPPAPGALLSYGTAVLALSLLVYWSVRDLTLVLVILGGSAAAGALLYIAGRLLIGLLGRFRHSVGVSWRYGFANVARRGELSAIQVVAFGLSLMVLLFLSLVRNDLMANWRATIADNAPNRFLINIQPDERESVAALLAEDGIEAPVFVPLVRARMTDINGIDVRERDYPTPRGKSFVRREANLTFSDQLSSTNKLVDGEWWAPDYSGEPLISVDAEVATDLGLALGDSLSFLIAGQSVQARLSSTREIDWDSFQPNFFMVFSPKALDGYPATYVAGVFVPSDKAGTMLTLARSHPSVSVIDVEAIMRQVREVIDRAALAVQAVFVFTLLAGLVVLFAAVQTTLSERRYESALLRTFGAGSATVLTGIAAEFVALGLAAGLVAAIGASLLGWLSAETLFGLSYSFDPLLWVTGVVGGALLVGFSGVLAARSAIASSPLTILRRYS